MITGKLPLHLFYIFVSCAAILALLILTVKLRLGFCSNWNNHTLGVHLFIIKCNLFSIEHFGALKNYSQSVHEFWPVETVDSL